MRFLKAALVAAVIAASVAMVGVVVWQHARPSQAASTATGSSRPHVDESSPPVKKDVIVLPAIRLGRPSVLTLAGIQEVPPPLHVSPRISAKRAIATAKARHAPGARSVQPVLVLFTDPSAGSKNVLAWDIRETGCFPIGGGDSSASPAPCDTHQLVIVNAKTGQSIEVIEF